MNVGSTIAAAAGVLVFAGMAATTASAGYVVNSRYSEFKRDFFDNQYPPPADQVYSTSGMGELLVTGSPVKHRSALSATGATYNAYCDSQNSVGPPAGSGRYGFKDTSRFEFVFTITGTANFTLAASLERWFIADSTLKLDPLTVGASPALIATASGGIENNFAPDIVNWSGTLLAGQYRLSIVDHGIGDSVTNSSYAKSSFTFTIPAPSTAAFVFALAIPAARRRRAAAM